MKRNTRNYLNISAKGQEKVRMFSQGNSKETIRMKQLQNGYTDLCKETRREAQAGEQMEKERKDGSKAHIRKQMLALALSR